MGLHVWDEVVLVLHVVEGSTSKIQSVTASKFIRSEDFLIILARYGVAYRDGTAIPSDAEAVEGVVLLVCYNSLISILSIRVLLNNIPLLLCDLVDVHF